MSAPALATHFSSEVQGRLDHIRDRLFETALELHRRNPELPKPVHYKELMKDKELVLRYHIEKKTWNLDIPEGFEPIGAM